MRRPARKQVAAQCRHRHLGAPRVQPARRTGVRNDAHGADPQEAAMTEPRSWLFVPADSERKITKALDSEADAIIFDLEDSVAPAMKAVARDLLNRMPKRPGGPEWWVRINPIGSEYHKDDLELIGISDIHGIVLPKA